MARLSTAAMALLMCLASQTACVRETMHINSEAKVAFRSASLQHRDKQAPYAFYGFSSIVDSEESLDIDEDFKYNQTFEGGDWETDGEGLPLNRTVARYRTNDEDKHCAWEGKMCNCRGRMCIFNRYRTPGASQELPFDELPFNALCEYKVEPTECRLDAMNTCNKRYKAEYEQTQCNSKGEKRCWCDPKKFNDKFDDETGTPKYDFERIIGEGSFGTIVLATKSLAADEAEREERTDVAKMEKDVVVKFIPREKWHETVQQEASLHKEAGETNLWVPAVVETIKLGCNGNACNLFLITDLAPGDSLDKYWEDKFRKEQGIPETVVRQIFSQLAQAVKGLHDREIVHRDIKMDNIMLDGETGKLMLLDFGFAAKVDGGKTLSDNCASVTYAAPELLRREPYRTEVDVWSTGVVLYFLVFGRAPFRVQRNQYDTIEDQRQALLDKIKDRKLRVKFPWRKDASGRKELWTPKFWTEDGAKKVKDLLKNMLKTGKRFDMEDVLEHDWVKGESRW